MSGTDQDKASARVPCPVCSAQTRPPYCVSCGFELDGGHREPAWPAANQTLAGGGVTLVISRRLGAAPGCRRYLAADEEGARFEVLATPLDDDTIVTRRARAVERLGAAPPAQVFDRAELRYTVTRLPAGETLHEALERLGLENKTPDPLEAVRQVVWPLVERLADLHVDGLWLGACDPHELTLTEGGCQIRDPGSLCSADDGPPPAVRRIWPGFAAPELLGHCRNVVGPQTDVFFAGAVLYYLLTGIKPLIEAGEPDNRLPPPQLYRIDVPPELAAVARRATAPLLERRYSDASAMLRALAWAIEGTEARRQAPHQRLALEFAHELHIGVLKGQFAPINQDDLFLGLGHTHGVGLFMIADGVSISEHGSGDQASTCVRESAAATWAELVGGQLEDPDEIDAAPAPIAAGGAWRRHHEKGKGPLGAFDRAARRRLIRRMLDRANASIAARIHADTPRFLGPPEGIMASTSVGVLLEGNRATFFSIGDSRAYLIRNGHIISLMPDHDLASQLLRMGRTPTAVRQIVGGGALVRCVGEFEKDPAHRLKPVPLQPDMRELTLLPGDRLLLCSDGIPDYSGSDEEEAEERMRQVVEAAPGTPWAAFELMVLANRGGGGDNISCIVLRFGGPMGEFPVSDEAGS